MLPINPRELQKHLKQLRRMGLKVEQLEGVERVVIELQNKELFLEQPQVMVFEIGGQKMFYVVATNIHETEKKAREIEEEKLSMGISSVSKEDVQFVAEYTGVSLEEAEKALIEAGGDIAKAIDIIQNRKRGSQ